MTHEAKGVHLLIDGTVNNAAPLNDDAYLRCVLTAACTIGGATVLSAHAHRFEPNGITVVCVLSESHASIHTYPDDALFFADFFTCGALDPLPAVDFLRTALHVEHIGTRVIQRPLEAG